MIVVFLLWREARASRHIQRAPMTLPKEALKAVETAMTSMKERGSPYGGTTLNGNLWLYTCLVCP